MKQKIGLLVGTNRTNAMTLKVATYYQQILEAKGHKVDLIDLHKLPSDFLSTSLYENQGKNTELNGFQDRIDGLTKIICFVPEYNGSFPGILKTFLDALRYPDTMKSKKVALVGLSSGVLGNAVGLGHLSDVLAYMGADLLGLRVKLGEIYKHFNGDAFSNPNYNEFVDLQVQKFLTF